MAKLTQTKTIDGYDVSVTQFEPYAALALAPKVSKLLLPMAPHIIAIQRNDEEYIRKNIAKIVPAFAVFCEQMDAAGPDLIYKLIAGTTIIKESELIEIDETSGKPKPSPLKNFDLGDPKFVAMAFTGRLDLLLKVAYYATEVNFFRYFFDLIARSPTPGAVTPSP